MLGVQASRGASSGSPTAGPSCRPRGPASTQVWCAASTCCKIAAPTVRHDTWHGWMCMSMRMQRHVRDH